MIVHRIAPLFFVFCIALWLIPATAAAHGGVVEEDDICVIKVNFLRAHFKIYQPRTSGHTQYCEDLPAATESVFVMEYLHDALSTMAIDFRIVRNVTGKGRFARVEDIDAIADLAAVTVYYRDASIDPDVYSVVYDFEEEGDFVGIVSATHAGTGKVYRAVFPFEVGFTGYGYWPFIIVLIAMVQLAYLSMSGRLGRRTPAAASLLAGIAFLLAATVGQAGELTVSIEKPDAPIAINQMHSWVIRVHDERGEPVVGATIDVDGGMPEHDHGLPTRPRITADLGNGNYRLEGVRFHMRGHWELVFTISLGTTAMQVTTSLQL